MIYGRAFVLLNVLFEVLPYAKRLPQGQGTVDFQTRARTRHSVWSRTRGCCKQRVYRIAAGAFFTGRDAPQLPVDPVCKARAGRVSR